MLPGSGGGSLPVAVAGLCSQCSPLPALLGWAWVTGDENVINTEQYFFHPHSYQTSPWYVICLEKSPYPILAQSIPLLCRVPAPQAPQGRSQSPSPPTAAAAEPPRAGNPHGPAQPAPGCQALTFRDSGACILLTYTSHTPLQQLQI